MTRTYTLAEVRMYQRMALLKIPEDERDWTRKQNLLAGTILEQEQERLSLEEQCRALGCPSTRAEFFDAVKNWIVRNDYREPTWVSLPEPMRRLTAFWDCSATGEPGKPRKYGDKLANYDVVSGATFSIGYGDPDPFTFSEVSKRLKVGSVVMVRSVNILSGTMEDTLCQVVSLHHEGELPIKVAWIANGIEHMIKLTDIIGFMMPVEVLVSVGGDAKCKAT